MEDRLQKKIGALLSNENHIWFHKQNEVAQDYMNAIFQEYKRQADECKVVLVDSLDLPFKVVPMKIVIRDKKKEKYDRAKTMEEFRKISREYEDR